MEPVVSNVILMLSNSDRVWVFIAEFSLGGVIKFHMNRFSKEIQ